MQKENLTKPDYKEFVPALLKCLKFIDLKHIIQVRAFFSEAFLLHTEDDVMDESEYRIEFANAVNYLNDICLVVKPYSEQEIDKAIKEALALLERKEVSNA